MIGNDKLTHLVDIQGYIQFTNNTNYWQAHGFNQVFQNATTFFQLGGTDVNVYGGGTLDGNGQVWYDLYAQNNLILRPILFGTIGLRGGSIGNLNFIQSPQYFNFVANSSDVIFYNLKMSAASKSKNVAKNTDGWDTVRLFITLPIVIILTNIVSTEAIILLSKIAGSTMEMIVFHSNQIAPTSWYKICGVMAVMVSVLVHLVSIKKRLILSRISTYVISF